MLEHIETNVGQNRSHRRETMAVMAIIGWMLFLALLIAVIHKEVNDK